VLVSEFLTVIAKAEKALEDEKPEIVAVEASIAHSSRKLPTGPARCSKGCKLDTRGEATSSLYLSEDSLEEYRRLMRHERMLG